VFLRDDANKTELFTFLSNHISEMVTIKQIIMTNGSDICIPPQDTNYLAPCDHKEADTRMILKLCVEELWIAFGVRKKFRYIPVHEIVVLESLNLYMNVPCL